MAEVAGAAERGLRLLAVAEAPWNDAQWLPDPSQYPFRWLGFVALADPLDMRNYGLEKLRQIEAGPQPICRPRR